jgi:hypothetical protein
MTSLLRRPGQLCILLVVLALVATAVYAATMETHLQRGRVWALGTSFSVSDVAVDTETDQVSGNAVFEDAAGITSVSGTFYVLSIDPSTDAVTQSSVTATPSIDPTGKKVRWQFTHTLPSGEDFYGVRFVGAYGSSGPVSLPLSATVAGYVYAFDD